MRVVFGWRVLVGVVLAVTLAPNAVRSQFWIGDMAGRAVAGDWDSQLRRDCLAQTGTAITGWKADGPRIDSAMSGFVHAAANRDAKAMKALFSRKAMRGVKGLDGVVLAPEMFKLESAAPLRRLAFVLGLKGAYGQGVWVQESTDPATPPLYFTAVFVPRALSYSIVQVWVTSEPEYAGIKPQDYCSTKPQPDLWFYSTSPPVGLPSSTNGSPSSIGQSGEKSK